MSSQVKGVSEVAKEVAGINELARTTAVDLRKNLDDVRNALVLTGELSQALKDAGVELRSVLSPQTNHPPTDSDEQKK